MTTFALIHGAWHGPSYWDLLVRELEARGHDAAAPDLPLHDPRATYAERAQPAIDALAGVDGPIVIVGHSMGSSYAPLVADAYRDALLAYLCPSLGPFSPPEGAPETFQPNRPAPRSLPDGTFEFDSTSAPDTLYARVPRKTARTNAQDLRLMAPAPDDFPLPTHPDVPKALIYAAEDAFFSPAWERFMARELLGIEPIEIPGGHFPMLEDPAALATVLIGLEPPTRTAGPG
jgi:pimeloyl-ACP methyl ester carboxylesterase